MLVRERNSARILVVDDDPDVLSAARLVLARVFSEVVTLQSVEKIEAALTGPQWDAIVLDMNFTPGARSGHEGLRWLARFRKFDADLSVILMTAFGEVSVAVEALKNGATDFVLKPWQNEKLISTVSAAVELSRIKREAVQLRTRNETLVAETSRPVGELVGSSPALGTVLSLIRRAAPTDANVLILGESGTGKELAARQLHGMSRRAAGPFVSVDLGAVSETLFESELFGHKRGAFTGAERDRAGRIQAAQGGTLFLDEIGNLPIHLQSKLLTVIERREVTPVGSAHPLPVDIRIVTATNRTAEDLRRTESFRQDLLFRIMTVEVVMPPLRARRGDIALLAEFFLTFYARKNNVPRRRLSPAALEVLERYDWPGNVRELRHVIERATILSGELWLGPEDFPLTGASVAAATPEKFDLEEIERETIRRALIRFDRNISLTAAAVGLTRAALYRRIAKHGL